jgi:hypothetical protein
VHQRSWVQDSEAAFSLLELLMAMGVTLTTAAVVFLLFHQSERVFRDQAVLVEMQQTARIVLFQVIDDIRMAGQGLPYGLADVILPGSNASRLNIRAGFSATESLVTSTLPVTLTSASPLTVGVESTTGFSANRQAFLWTETDWARVTINSVSGSAKTIRLTPFLMTEAPLSFAVPPTISTDEAVSIYRDAATQVVRRTTSTSTEDPSSPVWAPANELATHVTEFHFLYFDGVGSPLAVDTADLRAQVATIEIQITVQASISLSNGSRPTYSLSVRSSPRNLDVR